MRHAAPCDRRRSAGGGLVPLISPSSSAACALRRPRRPLPQRAGSEQPRHGAEQSTVDRLPEPNPYVHDGNDRNRAQPESQTGYSQLTLVPLANGPEGEQQRDRPSIQAANSLWVGERESDLHPESESGGEKGEAAAQQQGKRVEQDSWNQQPPGAGDLAEHQLDLRQHGDRNDQSVKPAFRNYACW